LVGIRFLKSIRKSDASMAGGKPSHDAMPSLTPFGLFALVLLAETDNFLLLLAEPVDPHAHDVAGLEPHRFGLHAERNAGRRPGGDHVAGLEHEELRQIPDEVRDAENHGFGRAALPRFAVHGRPHREPLWI